MFDIGRLCIKTAGRDAGSKCVVVDAIDDRYVLIDGQTRRRKCNIMHLEPLDQTIDVKKGDSHEDVVKALKAIGIEARETKPKTRTERPRKQRGKKVGAKPVAEKKKLFRRKAKKETAVEEKPEVKKVEEKEVVEALGGEEEKNK